MNPLEILFLGTGDAMGSGGRLQTCFHLRAGETQALIDCGTTALVAMKRFGVDPSGVDTVILSHLHGDHFGGLPFLILDGQFSRRSRPLKIIGPPGVEARVREAMEVFFPGSSQVQRKFAVEFRELQDRRADSWGPLQVTPYAVVHPSGAPSFALRLVIGGKILAYSGDTEWTESLAEAAHGADVFVAEAYFFDKKIKYHLDYQALLSASRGLECGRIILTHMSREMLERLAGVTLETAEDGKRIFLS